MTANREIDIMNEVSRMKILERPRRLYVPRHFVRAKIAQAVHRAVCDVTGTDGRGHCLYYAVAGGALAKKVLGRDYVVQAGSGLSLLADPPDGAITIDASDGGVDRGEFHVWLARPDPEPELVDFASRHFRHYVEDMLTIEQAHGPLIVLAAGGDRTAWQTAPIPISTSGRTGARCPTPSTSRMRRRVGGCGNSSSPTWPWGVNSTGLPRSISELVDLTIGLLRNIANYPSRVRDDRRGSFLGITR